MSLEGKWGYSTDEESYTGAYDSREEAIEEAKDTDETHFWVGRYSAPPSPESCIDAEDLIDKVLCQDEYCGDWAEGCLDCSKEQLVELTDSIRKVFGEWLYQHDLRPAFGLIIEPEEIRVP
jgi:hypothetical protein